MYIDLLIQLKNAARAGKHSAKLRFTKMDHQVAEVLQKYGFVKNVEVKGRLPRRVMEIDLNPERPIEGVNFLSRPSLKRYAGYRGFRRHRKGRGILVLTTPKGILAAREAQKEKVGGQLLFEVW
ncbi:30S ribosomal protein S8 [Candidatus Jorgensenbacteria bacterium CG10_big_fil_rev_8_21_14_0_10_54_38]|uniref:Small ribosomal subunit protein uS8 n=2 Tax=Candidatus Joergenseniibacteriota TaxID=1752739 RepID=A0A2M6WGD7_9BACT|nr:MAG: 30S ribosomal protein S8 [Candidatus Jorgensenbacteria bacterium CG23_combo_of_CG06-09_8_20_14_all_54_14]PIT91836.1 MAG: 30S ribosomal protein S8 [Candidatus Jorgensenbacteria bacterium CG10_big_fil_rev_8_21_14_0_10_54_38]